jgi:hypothetical protein
MIINHISQQISVFQGRIAPDESTLVGYGAIVNAFNLAVPLPKVLSVIGKKKGNYNKNEWQIFSERYRPEDSLYKHLVFSLKYEGVNLLILKKLFEKLSEKEASDLFQIEPTSQYSRRLWFLYEWLMNTKLDIPDLKMGNYVNVLDNKIQFALSKGEKSARHRVVNNLPGTKDFCPLIHRTEKLNNYVDAKLNQQIEKNLTDISKDILLRTSAFLMLKDSKASFGIEGETPKNKRAVKWANTIGQAGKYDLNKEELLRLQQLVIENPRFIELGFRKKGGFVGIHERISNQPIPEHISAKWQDLDILINGLIETGKKLIDSDFDPVLSATLIAFGFVFIHPFEDGNGRIHRYLIHHILAKKGFSKQGIIFPISASMLEHIDDYRKSLEDYSLPLLDLIDWTETEDHNIEVINETIDFYRYYDATAQAEFLYECVENTITDIIPKEINYLLHYDEFKKFLVETFEMPDKTVSLLVQFLGQNNGVLSERAKRKEFAMLSDEEIKLIESNYKVIFDKNNMKKF